MSHELNEIRNAIENSKTSIGIELGSTRIKTVLIGEDNTPIASGNYDWENSTISMPFEIISVMKVCRRKSKRLDLLRHTFVTRSLEAGMDILVLSRILGHGKHPPRLTNTDTLSRIIKS